MIKDSFAKYLLPEKPGLVSLVGAGGKTSLMFQLARELVILGKTVLTTTSTKILQPAAEDSKHTVCTEHPLQWLKDIQCTKSNFKHLTLARKQLDSNKLQGFAPGTIDNLWASGFFDWILVEADGAAGRPVKAPAEHEPVIPGHTSCTIAVLGLHGFCQPLTEKHIFRADLFSLLTARGLGEMTCFNDFVQVLVHEKGIMKGSPGGTHKILFLNQADNPYLQDMGREFISFLNMRYPDYFNCCAIGSMQ